MHQNGYKRNKQAGKRKIKSILQRRRSTIKLINMTHDTAYSQVNKELNNHIAWLITDGDPEVGYAILNSTIRLINMTHNTAYSQVNKELNNHIAWLITDGDPEVGYAILNQEQKQKVLNITQDITAAISDTPNLKQIGIALHLLKETRRGTKYASIYGICWS